MSSHCVLSRWRAERRRKLSHGSPYEGTDLMTEDSTLLNSLPPQSLPPHPTTLAIRTSTYGFGGARLVHNHSPHIFPYCLAPLRASSHPKFLGFTVSLCFFCSLCLGHMFSVYFHVLLFCDIIQLLAQMSPLEGLLLIAFSKNYHSSLTSVLWSTVITWHYICQFMSFTFGLN